MLIDKKLFELESNKKNKYFELQEIMQYCSYEDTKDIKTNISDTKLN